ncbi:hypothetical protein GCM10007938_00360 [Vibrio zhanjiangensis]|uniref:Thrombospondin type 3 repeat-containing protein n=1 Tax=Vibrio zhanjiangensis TaxID=1046128 RepID=A0ABQ6EUG8_9VIBR|nr:hypothetical protein [Vibrio zhanjiangensis]GLT16260.1 hypothetical protein GCM10007938_00360 [Vibrio zhanjiangensis]
MKRIFDNKLNILSITIGVIISMNVQAQNTPEWSILDSDNDGIPNYIESNGCDISIGGADGTFESLSDVARSDGHNGDVTGGGWENNGGSADSILAPFDGRNGVLLDKASPDGGVLASGWVRSDAVEGFSTELSGLEVGAEIRISAYQILMTDSSRQGGWKITFGDQTAISPLTTFTTMEEQQWEKFSITFKVKNETEKLKFAVYSPNASSANTYMGIDGIILDKQGDDCILDTDNDGVPDYLDLDSDNDGIPDAIEEINLPDLTGNDLDSDGIDNAIDVDSTGGTDTNGNGVDDAFEPMNSDNDGTPDYIDVDSDNDGILDALEEANLPELTGIDSDSDGIDDVIDVDQTAGMDNNSNGVDDSLEVTDTDMDGIPDYRDADSDNDGFPDSLEDSHSPELSGIDLDADGIDDELDVDYTQGNDSNGNGVDDSLEPTDSDGDGIADYVDLDSDNDGIPDVNENTGKSAISGLDSDNDGIDDAIDVDVTLGNDFNGDGVDDDIFPIDTDNDGRPNYLDLDSDNDSLPDSEELLAADNSGNYKFINSPNSLNGMQIAEVDAGSFGLAYLMVLFLVGLGRRK